MSLMIGTQEVMFRSPVFLAPFNRHNSHISDALVSKHLSIFFLIIHLSTQYCLDNMGGHKYKPFVQIIISVHRCVHVPNYSTHDSQYTKQLMKHLFATYLFSFNMATSCYTSMQRKEMFYLTTHSTHFIYGYMASNIWLRTILIVRKVTRCRHIVYSFRLTPRVLLYAPSHRHDSTYHGLCYTSRGSLAGTRNSFMGPPHEGYIYVHACIHTYIHRCSHTSIHTSQSQVSPQGQAR